MLSFENFLNFVNAHRKLFDINDYGLYREINDNDLIYMGMLIPSDVYSKYTDELREIETGFAISASIKKIEDDIKNRRLLKIQREKDKELQKQLLDIGYFNAYKRYHFLKFKYERLCYKDEYFSFNEDSLKYLGLLKISKFDNSCDRLINNRSSKSSNIKKKIKFLLDNYDECVFITLTFTDKFLENTNSTTRRQYVKRFFNEQCLKYVANIDFGQNDSFSKREHYHAICNGKVDNSFWNCGAVNFEKIHNYGNSEKLLSKYINKFVNHTIKKGACSTRLLASQNFFEK